jgi:signal transduction histidine kinase
MGGRAVLHAIAMHASVGIGFYGPDGDLLFENEYVRRRRGEEFGPIVHWNDLWARLSWEDGRTVTRAQWDELLRAAKSQPLERLIHVRTTTSPTPRIVWFVIAPVRREDGRLLGVIILSRDVTSEHAIRKLREELIAVIAHDLRNPIAAIALSTDQALRRSPGADDGRVAVSVGALQRIRHNAGQLGDMVSALLDASRIELGAITLDRSVVDLGDFLSQVVCDVAPSLRGHDVQLDLPPRRVEASIDRLRLTQVLTNLLDNASKYGHDATPIRVVLREEGPVVHVSVADQGEGISPADLPKLFDRFYQAQRARQKKSGLGLGLYITKGIVDAHGGTLTVDTALGVGTTFHLRLPSREGARDRTAGPAPNAVPPP